MTVKEECNMARTIVGLFDTFDQAQRAVQGLIDQGFPARDISVIAADAEGRITGTSGENAVAESAGAGAVGGTVVGGVLGLLVGLGALAIPGIGPVIAAGPLAAAIGTAAAAIGTAALGAGIGAASGGLLGALVGAGIPEEEAGYYSEGVRRGGTLVAVSADESMADSAQIVLNSYGAVDIRERSASWGDRSTWGDSSDTTTYTDTASQRAVGDQNNWEQSSKAGTAGGAVAGAATGAAIGAAGGPVGAVVGGVAGAVTGAGVGAAGDTAGRTAEERGAFDDNYFRNDYNTNYASSGYTYEQYDPAYRYGYDAAYNPSYRNRNWNDVERDMRGGWDADRYGPWDRFKDAVRRGWERTKDAATNDFDGGMSSRTTSSHDYGSARGGEPTSSDPAGGPYTASPRDFGGESTGTRGYGYSDESSGTTSGSMSSSTVRSYDDSTTGSTMNRTGASADRAMGETKNNWEESSKAGTAGGAVAGAATGAAIGAVGGPVGAVVGGVAGAVTGAGVGAAGDAAGEAAEDAGYFDDDYFRNDYNTNYASSGYTYEQYDPAYRYGTLMGRDPMYRSKTWYDVEDEFRSGWDADRYGPWDRFKDAVRRGWERTKGAVR
jgi:hypothetical protein